MILATIHEQRKNFRARRIEAWRVPTTCGECEYEEADGTLRWQCATCALGDVFRDYLLAVADTGRAQWL